MAALTSGILLSDLAHWRSDRLITHFFLGGIVTALFYMMCQNGYEMVNWVIILVIPLYIFVRWLFSGPSVSVSITKNSDDDDDYECPVCKAPPRRKCECRGNVKPLFENKQTGGCPAKPIRLSTECGISRYT